MGLFKKKYKAPRLRAEELLSQATVCLAMATRKLEEAGATTEAEAVSHLSTAVYSALIMNAQEIQKDAGRVESLEMFVARNVTDHTRA